MARRKANNTKGRCQQEQTAVLCGSPDAQRGLSRKRPNPDKAVETSLDDVERSFRESVQKLEDDSVEATQQIINLLEGQKSKLKRRCEKHGKALEAQLTEVDDLMAAITAEGASKAKSIKAISMRVANSIAAAHKQSMTQIQECHTQWMDELQKLAPA